MSKYTDVAPETENIFNVVLGGTTLPQNVKVKIQNCPTLKTIGNAAKVSDQAKIYTDDDVLIYLNEEIFDMLDENQQVLVADSLIASISYSSEKDVLKITKEDVITHSGILTKYGGKETLNVLEIIRHAIAAKNEKD